MFFHYLFWVTLLLIALRLTIYIFTCEKLFQIYATFSLSTHRTLVMHVFLCLMLPHIFLRLYSFPSFLCWLFFKLHTLLFCLHLYWFCLLTIHIFCWSSLGKKFFYLNHWMFQFQNFDLVNFYIFYFFIRILYLMNRCHSYLYFFMHSFFILHIFFNGFFEIFVKSDI